MSPFKTSLITSLLSIVVTAGGLTYFQHKRLRESRQLQRQNEQMRVEASRRYLAMMAAKTPPVSSGPTAPTNALPASVAASPPTQNPAESYRNEGNATPLAALQTFAWACDRGDTEAVRRLLHIDVGARPKAEAFMASLPAAGRSHWKNVDEMAAKVLIHSIMARPYPNADILETATVEPITADRVRVRLSDVPIDGTEYQKTAEGWKYVLTEAVVDNYIKRMKERSAQAAR
jgi:hypothetical protein